MTDRKMPPQKPGLSRQDYATPPEFMSAVMKKFDISKFTYDLAASVENAKAENFFCEEEDSLSQDWRKLKGNLWLNPPYADIAPWAMKCSASREALHSRRIFFLVPASVGSNWFLESIHKPIASGEWGVKVYFLNGRISFDGKAPYPKDCMLVVFDGASKSGYDVWSWKEKA